MNKGTALVCVLLSFLAGAGWMWGTARSANPSLSAEAARGGSAGGHESSPIAIADDDPMWGKRDAPVTIVEVSDFECPFCARAIPTMARIQKAYGADKVRLVWKHSPLPSHPGARPAAEAAATVHGLGGDFWKFAELAFARQRNLSLENFASWAAAAGVDQQAFRTAYSAKRYAPKVDKDLAWVRQVGASGTPNFSFLMQEVSVGAASNVPALVPSSRARRQPRCTLRSMRHEYIAACEGARQGGASVG